MGFTRLLWVLLGQSIIKTYPTETGFILAGMKKNSNVLVSKTPPNTGSDSSMVTGSPSGSVTFIVIV